MQQIPCPWCGRCNETEFRFESAGGLLRPAEPGEVTDDRWSRFLFPSEDIKGLQIERWNHAHGCQGWFYILRDTVSHEIRATSESHEGLGSKLG